MKKKVIRGRWKKQQHKITVAEITSLKTRRRNVISEEDEKKRSGKDFQDLFIPAHQREYTSSYYKNKIKHEKILLQDNDYGKAPGY